MDIQKYPTKEAGEGRRYLKGRISARSKDGVSVWLAIVIKDYFGEASFKDDAYLEIILDSYEARDLIDELQRASKFERMPK